MQNNTSPRRNLDARGILINYSRNLALVFMIVVMVTLIVAPLEARAGGAGGGSSSSSSYSGGSSSGDDFAFVYMIFQIFNLMVRIFGLGPTLVILGIVFLVSYLAYKRHQKAQTSTVSVMEALEKQDGLKENKAKKILKDLDPNFDPSTMENKVRTGFLAIQNAWSSMDLGRVRPFISDGVWQRFSTQFTMMKALGQTNRLDGIQIHGVSLVDGKTEGPFASLTYKIHASMRDRFLCSFNPKLNQDSNQEFSEYWTFLRKYDGSKQGDLYHGHECPSCGGPLDTNMGEISKCQFCSATINSPQWDWVLAEIIQSDDQASRVAWQRSTGSKNPLVRLQTSDTNLSTTLLADKASNAWFQIQAGISLAKPTMMRRFCTDELYESLKSQAQNPFYFNRLYLKNVEILSASQDQEWTEVQVSLASACQRVQTDQGGKLILKDPVLLGRREIMTLRRKIRPLQAKGSLFLHQCPACGGLLQDSNDTSCPYCSTELTAGSHDWVVSSLVPANAMAAQGSKATVKSIAFDRLYDVKDYALNNFFVMAAADGVFADEERAMAQRLAQGLGYRIENLEALFSMASSGKLSIKMPYDTTKREKILTLMEETAQADGSISPEEQEIISYIKRAYMQAGDLRF